MSKLRPITAILVAYNSAGVIKPALQALLADARVGQVMVVDNCSRDDTCELIREHFPSVILIENPRNEGFGRGNNLALSRVQTPYALLVNPDAVMEEGATELLIAAANAYPDAAILAPALYDEQGKLHESYKKNVFEREKQAGNYCEPQGECCAEFLSGAVWLLSMKHMQKIGFFDPNIFLFYEDDDLCLRARRAGFGLVLVPQAKAVHLMGASSGKPKPEGEFFKQKHMAWSRLYLEEKYLGKKAAQKLETKLHLIYALKAGFYALTLKHDKLNRYRGRLAGLDAFTETSTQAPGLPPATRRTS